MDITLISAYRRRHQMEQAISSIAVEPEHIIEIVVHITDALEEQQRMNFVAALENDERISAVSFFPTRCHLMLVKYDRDHYSSQDVLASIESRKVSAKLVGPI
jgi:chromatin segregation and condensation protein Rec8/ScpA/Scc1 (kleisin family)